MIERLEQRRLLTVPVSGGTATVTGTTGNDVLELVVISGVLQVRNGAGTVVDSVSAGLVSRISVNGGGGADYIRMGRGDGTFMPAVPCTLRGGAGNDTLIGGTRDDQLFGESENDRLDGRAGRDLLDGGLGFDSADYAARTVQVKVTLANSTTANDGSNSGDNTAPSKYNDLGGDNCKDVEAVLGGAAGDILAGSTAANWFDGGGGNDSIYGGSGIDTIYGGSASDLAYGEGDNDSFYMQEGIPDLFNGGSGSTSAQFDSGTDQPAPNITSSPSTSSLTTTTSIATATLTSTTSEKEAAGPTPSGSTPSLDKWVDVVLSPEDVQAQKFTYTEKRNSPPLDIPDYLIKRLKALQPDGTLLVEGTFLSDVITLTQTGGLITVNTDGELFDAEAILVTRVVIRGLEGDDSITTDGSLTVPVVFEGGEGNDSIGGGGTDDALYGGNGNDFIWGRAGNDDIFGEAGDDVLIGEAGDDLLDGAIGRDILIGGTGIDELLGGDGDDILIAGATAHDNNLTALTLLTAEWTRPDLAYPNRVANINGNGVGGGNNETFYLRPGDAANKTVFDDGVVDVLSGQGDTDWFFAQTKDPAPDVLDRVSGETLTQL